MAHNAQAGQARFKFHRLLPHFYAPMPPAHEHRVHPTMFLSLAVTIEMISDSGSLNDIVI
jgi:hypothetical protein